MLMAHHDRVAIAVHDAVPPTDDEWADWLQYFIERPDIRDPRALIDSQHGVGPNAKQRKLLRELTHGMDVRAAILTDSIVVRGIVTAIAWLGIAQRAFRPAEQRAASVFLELSPEEEAWALAALDQLRVRLEQRSTRPR